MQNLISEQLFLAEFFSLGKYIIEVSLGVADWQLL